MMTRSSIQILAEGFSYGIAALLLSMGAFLAILLWALSQSSADVERNAKLPINGDDHLVS